MTLIKPLRVLIFLLAAIASASAITFDFRSGASNAGNYENDPTRGSYDKARAIDNQGWLDYVIFNFSETIELGSVYMKVWGDGDFDYWIHNATGAPSSGATRVNRKSSGWANLNGSTSYLMIGAESFNNRSNRRDRDDRFKIKKLSFEKSPSKESNCR